LKKTLLLLATATLLSLSSFAQWSIGLSGGYAYNHYDYDPQYMYGFSFRGHHGIAIDIPVGYQFGEHLGVFSGLSAQQKGYWMKGVTSVGAFYPFVYRNDWYLVTPLVVEYKHGGENFNHFIDVGGYAAGWIASTFYLIGLTQSGETPSFHFGYKEFNNCVDNRMEFGLVAGTGIEWQTKTLHTWFTHVRCYFALSSQQKHYQTMFFPSRNTTVLFQIGKKFSIKPSRK